MKWAGTFKREQTNSKSASPGENQGEPVRTTNVIRMAQICGSENAGSPKHLHFVLLFTAKK